MQKSYKIASFKALDDEPGTFEAVVSVFGNVDLQGDRTMPGAFKKTIAAWRTKGDPIPVIWSHEWLNPEAHIGFAMPSDVMEIAVAPGKDGETGGLLVKGHIDMHKPFAAQVFDLLKERRIREWSFAYDTVREKKAEDGANELYEVDLIEVGPTLKGANSSTYTIGAKSVMEEELKEAYEIQRSLSHFIELIKDVDDPDIARMLTKTYTASTPPKKTMRFHVEKRLPEFDGEKYALTGSEAFACIANVTGSVVDMHDTEGEAEVHVKRLETGDTTSLRDDDIRKALGLDPIVLAPDAEESKSVGSIIEVTFDGHKFEVAPEALALVEEDEAKRVGGNGIVDESQLEGVVVDEGKTTTKPWHIEERGDEYCVIKDDTDEEVACHPTRAEAEAQIRALYANESSDEADSEKALTPDEAETEFAVAGSYILTSNTGTATTYNVTSSDGNSTWLVSTDSAGTKNVPTIVIPVDGLKAGRAIGRASATALKEALIRAVDDFVKSVNERESTSDDGEEEKATEPESPSEWLDRMLEEK